MKLTKQQAKVLQLIVDGGGQTKNYHFHRAYVMNYTARISELRQKGFDIRCHHVKRGVKRYEVCDA